MVRTQIYLTEKEHSGLAALSKASGKKQSELIREAVDNLIHQFSHARRDVVLNESAGMWKKRKDLPDFGDVRRQWDRD